MEEVHLLNEHIMTELRKLVDDGSIKLFNGDQRDAPFEGEPEVYCDFQKVTYDKVNPVKLVGDTVTTENIYKLLIAAPFSKPPSFTKEREYRFLFVFKSGNISLQPDVDAAFIPIGELKSRLLNVK
jgi:hypothetical protein